MTLERSGKVIAKVKADEGNGNGKFVVNDTPERKAARDRVGALVADLRPFLQYAAARRVSSRLDLRFPVQCQTGHP